MYDRNFILLLFFENKNFDPQSICLEKHTRNTVTNIKKGIDRGRKISRRIATSFATLRE